MAMTINILIVGAGAVGAFYASRLALAPECSVCVICRSNYSAVKANGFSITSPYYDPYTFKPAQTFSNPREAVDAQIQWDYIVVSTKALPDVSDDSSMLSGLVGPQTSIVLVQNGLGVEAPYAQRFPKAAILSAITVISASQPEHGRIQHNRWTRITIGPYLPHLDTSSAPPAGTDDDTVVAANQRFVELLLAGAVRDAEAYDHSKLQQLRWHKCALNAAMNPSSVLSQGTANGRMAQEPELAVHIRGVMDEVLETAVKVLGRPFPAEFASAQQILESTARNKTGSRPSMWADWEQGKPMELEVILGNPIRMARSRGLDMPRLQGMYALLRMAQENRDKARSAGKGSKL